MNNESQKLICFKKYNRVIGLRKSGLQGKKKKKNIVLGLRK
jgi:hypothetical protein